MIPGSERSRPTRSAWWVGTLARALRVATGRLARRTPSGAADRRLRASDLPRCFDAHNRLVTVVFSGGVPGRPRWRRRRALQRVVVASVDVVIALVALVVTAPLFAMAILALRLSGPGPVFSRQPGIGARGQAVELVGFRTDAAPAVRAVLRATGIERLPRLVNLARAEVSLFGRAARRRALASGGA